MPPLVLKDLFFSHYQPTTLLTPIPLLKNPPPIDKKLDEEAVIWTEPTFNGLFTYSIPLKDFFKYNWTLGLLIPSKKLKMTVDLPVDLPDVEHPLRVPLERKGLLTTKQTMEKLKELSADDQEKLARSLIYYGTEIGLALLTFDHFRLLEKELRWGLVSVDPTIFQNPVTLHSKEGTRRILSKNLMRYLTQHEPALGAGAQKGGFLETKLEPFYEECKKIHAEASKINITKIVLSIISFGLLPLYYLVRSAIILKKSKDLIKKLEKQTLKIQLYKIRADKIYSYCKELQPLLGNTHLPMKEKEIVIC